MSGGDDAVPASSGEPEKLTAAKPAGPRFVVRYRARALAAAGGVVFALSSPPTDFLPAIVIGLAFLAASMADAPTARRALGRAVIWGTAAQIVGLRFVPEVIVRFTPLPAVAGYVALALLAAAQSLTWGIGMAVASLCRRRLRAPLELSFAAGTFVALSLPSIFAWSPAGLFTPWPALVQLADLIGERGVSALIAVAAALLARGATAFVEAARASGARRIDRKAFVPIVASVGLLAAMALYGVVREKAFEVAQDTPTIRIGLVDQAVPPLDRWDPKNHPAILANLRELTADVEREGAELTVWPEAAYPYVLDHESPHIGRRAGILGGDVKGPVLFGLITRTPPSDPDRPNDRDSNNSATIVNIDGSIEPSADKLQLLWFGEMVPGADALPWLRHLFARSGALVPGKAPRALTLARDGGPALTIEVLNCYEDTLSSVGRRMANEIKPNLLVNVTNDAWFYDTAESELHARLGAMRAVELRRDLVRAVNLGVMTWVDARGVVRARYADSRRGTLLVTPALIDASPTPFAVVGDAPVFALFVALGLASWWRARRAA